MVKNRKQDFHFQKNNSQITFTYFTKFSQIHRISTQIHHGLKTHKFLILLTGSLCLRTATTSLPRLLKEFRFMFGCWISSLVQPKWFLVGGWTNPFENMSQNGNLPQIGVEIKKYKKYLKPPPRFVGASGKKVSFRQCYKKYLQDWDCREWRQGSDSLSSTWMVPYASMRRDSVAKLGHI